ncbi:MAG TPA: methyltransferase [Sedimentisphaerales bacterium]|mgnify:CR=1 FL=1|nr:methyltransferase [Sedimentisphaerales bacterium]HRS10188.1 methyltransferase [Sedimentisphaerales bacterium]HRV46894.1 methyltransferase [Sedimentisphaerales bacterium]
MPLWTEAKLLETARSFQPACVLLAAADLDLFTVLDRRPATAAALASTLNTDLRATTILLDALAALDLLEKRGDVYTVPGEVGRLLCEGSPASVLAGLRHQANCLRRWVQLPRVVRDGGPAQRTPSIRGQAADVEAFIGAMDNFSVAAAPTVVSKLGPPTFQRLLDIGGASGTWTIAFLRAVPEATAVLLDLPEVVPLAKRRLTSAGLLDRVTLVAADYNTDDLPGGADLVWLSAIAHQNSRPQNRVLFARIHGALTPGGTLVVRDVVLDRSRTKPPAGALFAVNMLVGTEGGNSYTFEELRDDLAAAGFVEIELLCRDDGMNSLIRAGKS